VDINVGQLFISLLVLVFSLTVHESAHAWAADRLGDSTARLQGRISLNPAVHVDPVGTLLFPILGMVTGAPLFGWAKPVPVNIGRFAKPRRDYLMVAAAGPLSNLALAVAAALALQLALGLALGLGDGTASGGPNVIAPLTSLAYATLQVNVLLAIFNMLPIPPLDGGTVLAGVLPERFAAGLDRIRPYGFLLLYALLFSGGFGVIVGTPYRYIMSWLL
jgi:Zn-dependent protease